MLVTLGARNTVSELVDLLAACHRRIRQHLVFARRLIVRGSDSSPQDLRETAGQVRRYFQIALPLHIDDEELSIAPRLRAVPEVRAALATVAHDHKEHQRLIDALIDVCAEIERDPTQLAAVEGRLASVLDVLAPELAGHLDLEERVVFPAVRMLPVTVRDEILGEMRGRRGGELSQ